MGIDKNRFDDLICRDVDRRCYASNVSMQLWNNTIITEFWSYKGTDYGEFDPGSGWTLAGGLIHASRGAA